MAITITTKKGTELPLLDLRGKPYLQVAHRLVWFREEHPDWTIETEIVKSAPGAALLKATIKTPEARILATAHKMETKQGFADYLEKAETGAIGRALALCGYGTQFEPEMDEGERLADSPINPPSRAAKLMQEGMEAVRKPLPVVAATPEREGE